MALTEDAAAKIVLIRSIEECDPRAFSEELRARAFVAAQDAEPGLSSIERYAARLFEHLSPWYQSILQLAKIPAPWTFPVCFAAFLLGLATNLLGPARQIHVIRNPIFILIAWNLLVFLTLFVLFLRRKIKTQQVTSIVPAANTVESLRISSRSNQSKVPWVVKHLLPGVWHFFHRMIFAVREQRNLAQIMRRFSHHWFSVAGALVVSRWRRLLHLGSVFIATGAVAGMYFRGLFQGYRVVWDSTFIVEQESVATFIRVLFAPSLWISNLFGLGLANRISVDRLLTPGGDEADGWIHLFAISVLLAVVLPRLALAAWQSSRIRRLSGNLALPLDHYYGEVIEGPIRLLIEKEVAEQAQTFSAKIAGFVATKLYDEQIVPKLISFRERGGKIADLKSELTSTTVAFLPKIQSFITDTALPELQLALSQRLGEVLKSIGTSFIDVKDPQIAFEELSIFPAGTTELKISNEFSRALAFSVGTSIALAIAAVGGGIGEQLGIAIIATVLGTTGPIGFLIGLVAGAVVAAGAWWFGKDKITETVEHILLPAAVVRTALWQSRFQRLLAEAREKCEESVRAKVDENLHTLIPQITDEILLRLRRLRQS
jgi:predicted membrane protein